MAVQLGYRNVYRDPLGLPEWQRVCRRKADRQDWPGQFRRAKLRSVVRMGHDLDPSGDLCGRDRAEPYSLRLPDDSHHRLVFRGPGSSGQAGKGRWSTRTLLSVGCPYQFGSGSSRRLTGGLWAPCLAPGGPDPGGRGLDCIRNQPFRPLGATPSQRPNAGGGQILHRIFRKPLHGAHPGRRSSPLHRPVCSGASYLGGQHGESLDRVHRLLHPEHRARAAAFILALFSGQLHRLPRSGGWMLWVRKLMGWVLVGMASISSGP